MFQKMRYKNAVPRLSKVIRSGEKSMRGEFPYKADHQQYPYNDPDDHENGNQCPKGPEYPPEDSHSGILGSGPPRAPPIMPQGHPPPYYPCPDVIWLAIIPQGPG